VTFCDNRKGNVYKEDCCKKAKLQAGIKPTALCSVIDKENSIEFPLDFLHYLYNYYIVCALLFHALSCDLSCDVMWCDSVTFCHVTMTLWHSWCDTFPHFPLCSKSKIKEKKKKKNINNNLAVLPSHDNCYPTDILRYPEWRRYLGKTNPDIVRGHAEMA